MVSVGYGAANAIGIGVSLAILVVAVISMRRRMLAVPASCIATRRLSDSRLVVFMTSPFSL